MRTTYGERCKIINEIDSEYEVIDRIYDKEKAYEKLIIKHTAC